MTNANPSRIGQINSQGDALALMLKVYGGEVLTQFNRASVMRALMTLRSIAYGKQAQFPVTGSGVARLHTPGEQILGQKLNSNEVTIDVEGLTIADVFIPNIDEWLNHFDYRSIYAEILGQALAKKRDQNGIHTLANAARKTTANVNGVYAGDTLTSTSNNAAYATDGAVLVQALYDAGVIFDTRDIPEDGRYILVRPVQHALAVKSGLLTDITKNQNATDLGGMVTGTIKGVNNMGFVKTNNFTAVDDRTNTEQPTSRQKDYSTSVALVGHKSAVGELSIKDLAMESEYQMSRQGTLMLGKFMSGSGPLRNEAAYELRTADPAA